MLEESAARGRGSIRRLSGVVRIFQFAVEVRHPIGIYPEIANFVLYRRQRTPNYGDRRPGHGRRSDRRFLYTAVRSGKLAGLLEKTERGRIDAGRQTMLRKVCEINISVSSDYEKARNFPKRYIAHMLVVLEAMGFSKEEFAALGVDREIVIRIKEAFEAGGTIEEVSALISDGMVDVGFIAGTPRDCVKPLEEMCAYAQKYGFDQICLAKLGPDYEEAITVLARDLLPSIVQRRGID